MKTNSGYTLVELIIIITIIGTVSIFGFDYIHHTRKAKLTAASDSISGLYSSAKSRSQAGLGNGNWQVTRSADQFTLSCPTCTSNNKVETYTLPENITMTSPPPSPIIFQKITGQMHSPDISTPLTSPASITLNGSNTNIRITIPPQGPIQTNTLNY